MKLTLPSKKFQIRLAFTGGLFAILIAVLFTIADTKMCSSGYNFLCSVILYTATFFDKIAWTVFLPFIKLQERIFQQIYLNKFESLGILIIFFSLAFWIVGSILWIAFTAIKNTKNKL